MSTDEPERGRGAILRALALFVALVAVAGSLYLSLAMNLKACPLCLYQRAFAMSAFAMLAMGLFVRQRSSLLVYALPVVDAGLGVAVFHEYLEANGKLECPPGLFGVGTAPQQSLAVLTLLFVIVLIGAIRTGPGLGSVLAGLVLGSLLAWGAIMSAPPPPIPKQPYDDKPIDMCRPPYVAAEPPNIVGD